MRFLDGAPVFAAEVRSENDYGPEAERMIAKKRPDYFRRLSEVAAQGYEGFVFEPEYGQLTEELAS